VPILEALGKGYTNSFVNNDAMKCFNALLKQQPDHARAILWRGKISANMERHDRALKDYERAVALAPALDEARLRLAATLHRFGRSWEAVPHYECLRQRQPGNADVLLGLARCRYELHESAAAREMLDALLLEHPEHAPALLERGRLEFHTGNTAAAESWLRRAAERAPLDHDTQRALLLCLQALGKDAAAQRCLGQLEQIDLLSRPLHALLQQARDRRRDAPLCWNIGQGMQRLGREQEAVSWYFAALSEDERYAPAHAALADCFQRSGQRYRAERQRRQALTGKDR
jgi:tetratricopeptide (TPR) repeat protein